MNDALKTIGEKLLEADSVLIFPHANLDGDAVGSSAALCAAMRKLGKESYVLVAETVPKSLRFLDHGYTTMKKNRIAAPDVCVCVDCGEPERFSEVQDQFHMGKVTVCLDHHPTSLPFADYNHIDKDRAATAELVFSLLQAMDVPMDKEIGEALFTGIVTDTGNFQYSNTTKETHLIAAKLYDVQVDVAGISAEIYQSKRPEELLIRGKILDTLELFAGGQAAIAFVTEEMLRETGAETSETDGVVEMLRSIKGVEIAVFVKEKDKETVRVSLRAKQKGNVMEIASKFHGGGHIKAAGCTIEANVSEAVAMLKQEVERNLEK